MAKMLSKFTLLKFLSDQLWLRRVLLLGIDIALVAFSFYMAHFLRLDGDIVQPYYDLMLKAFPLILICRAFPFFFFGFYNRYWEYSSLEDMVQIFKAVVTGTLMFTGIIYFGMKVSNFPRSVIAIEMVLTGLFLGGVRLLWRLWIEGLKNKDSGSQRATIKALVYGAGDTGVAFLKYIGQQFPQYEVCGFIDDDPFKTGKVILGKKVLGVSKHLESIAANQNAKEVFIASNKIKTDDLNAFIETCNQNNLHCKMVSPVIDLATNKIRSPKIRKIEIADLLGRQPVSLDFHSIGHLIKGRTVLVTGAGGSIGSELCRQILEFEPEVMVMVDKGENYLHDLSLKMNPIAKNTRMFYEFTSVTLREKMSILFYRFKPQVVFHAAAHKHVPLMENHADEAVYNNVYGTKIVADLAAHFGAQKFILVSTDKVVRPTNVMGMTKRAAELYTQYMGSKTQTRFITVRFGNVLGSNGSVVPLFKSQIEAGGPITVTHPDMKRFFMLISEAAQLIVQAAAIGNGREIFILEMGDQIRIQDLARKMISLSGYIPDKDIEIKYTGIRPGEKMYEELVGEGEQAVPTFHEKIKILRADFHIDEAFEKEYQSLYELKDSSTPEEIKARLKEFITTHTPKTEVKS